MSADLRLSPIILTSTTLGSTTNVTIADKARIFWLATCSSWKIRIEPFEAGSSAFYETVCALRDLPRGTRWLDYECGNGGWVRWLSANAPVEAYEYEEGWIAKRARERASGFSQDRRLRLATLTT